MRACCLLSSAWAAGTRLARSWVSTWRARETAAATPAPVPTPPARQRGPSNQDLVSATRAKGETFPAWPPAPAATKIKPSAPLSTAFLAWVCVVTSWKTIPPYARTASLISRRAPRDVITTGTLCSAMTSISLSSLAFDLCTIWFTANGVPGGSSALIVVNHSSRTFSRFGPRAFNAGNEPRIPARHCATTSFGVDTRNNGEPTIGSRNFCTSAAAAEEDILKSQGSLKMRGRHESL
mmetsp:Transcript_15201/g.49503  ORF Transcript_15201/g.49503 Transcript_15201/m.49503 type:complete len:237 (+) Transcript_15201:442-1152(+)